MWTTLGVLLFAAMTAFVAHYSRNRRWSGKARDGYAVRALSSKGSLLGLEIGVPARTFLDFELKREGRFDRFAKAIGLAVEAQVGRPGFDDALYLVCDVPRVPSALRADRELADELQALFELAPPPVRRVQRVVCVEGTLVLKAAVRGAVKDADAIAATLAPPVIIAAQHLEERHPGTPQTDPLWWRATLVLALGIGLFAHGLLDVFHLVVDWGPRTLDVGRLWLIAVPVAVLMLAALMALGLALLGRSSRAHLVLAQALAFAVLGAPLGAMTQVRDLNIEADRSPGQAFVTTVRDTHVSATSKGAHTYSVTLDAWPGMPDGYKMNVTHDDYYRYFIGHRVDLVQRHGAFGVRWLASVKPRFP